MKKIISVFVLFLFTLLFTGCPYKSNFPIDKSPEIPVDTKLIGKWGTSGTDYYNVSKKSNYLYSIIYVTLDSNDVEEISDKYEGFLSKVDNVTYLNLRDLSASEGEGEYYLYKFEYKNDKIILTGVTPYIKEKFSDSEDLKKFFKKNQENSYFFTDPQEYQRIR
ncbi:MAG: hypothetical protein N2490_05670 [Ignavibacteria bacterium]|nr:hypothetical protein [Ignavibacteria bacterium]